MTRFALTDESFLIIHSTSSVHPIRWTARSLGGSLTASVDSDALNAKEPIEGVLSVAVADLKSGTTAYDLQLPRAVHAKKFPEIRATLNHLEPIEGETYRASGSLSFHGSELEIEAPIRVQTRDGKIRLSGELGADLRSFGFEPPRVLGLKVHPEVRIEFAAVGAPIPD